MIPQSDQFRIRWSGSSFHIRVTDGYAPESIQGSPRLVGASNYALELAPNETHYIYLGIEDEEVYSNPLQGSDLVASVFLGTVVTGATGVVSCDQPATFVWPDGTDIYSGATAIDVTTLTAEDVVVSNDITAPGTGTAESSLDIMGGGTFRHRQRVWSGGQAGKFAETADHAHGNELLIKSDESNLVRYGWHNGIFTSRSGLSVYSNTGVARALTTTAYTGTEVSLDTTGTQATFNGGEVSGVVKVRFSNSVQLDAGTPVLFQVTTAVAGLQATVYSAIVTQAPTLVGSNYEALIKLFGLDSAHWASVNAANTSALNSAWEILFPTGSEVAGGNKVSLARDTSGPTDQLVATFGAAHSLVADQIVSLFVSATTTGLTGTLVGYYLAGYVVEATSTTVAKIRIRNVRDTSMRSFSGSTTTNSAWAFFTGARDPFHEIVPATNSVTAWRNQTTGGVVRMAVGGGCDAIDGLTNAAAIGFDQVVLTSDTLQFGTGAANLMTLRGGDLQLVGQSVRTMAGARAPMGGVRAMNDGSTTNGITTTVLPMVLGSADFAVAFIAEIVASNTGFSLMTVGITGTLLFAMRQPNSSGVITLDNHLNALNFPAIPTSLFGTVAAFFLERVGTTVTLWINGILIGSLTAASHGTSLDSTALVRFGGGYIASSRGNCVFHRGWMFQHLLTQADRDFITVRGRLPNALQWAPTANIYASDFSAGVDGWVGTACTLTGNIDGIGGQDNNLRAVIDSANTTHLFYKIPPLPRGKRCRIMADVYRPAANATVTGFTVQHYNQATTTTNVQLAADTWTAASHDVDDLATTGNNGGIVWNFANAAGSIVFAGNGTDILYIRNVRVQRLGAFLALDFGVGVGNQVIDVSGNGLHATLVAPFEHVVPLRTGQVRQRVTASGNTQITAGIPINARITAVTATAAGAVTLSIGNASAGTQIVNAQVLASGRQDVTLAGRFSTTGNLWANLSSAVQVDITVHYEIAD